MADPTRIEFTDTDEASPRAAPPSPVRVREIPIATLRQDMCAICARKGFKSAVEFTASGAPTGLCHWHNRFESELRAELKLLASMQTLTPKIVAEARQRIVQRMKETAP